VTGGEETPAKTDEPESSEVPTGALGGSEDRSRFAALRERFTRSESQLEEKYHELESRRAESAPVDVAFRVAEADRRVSGGLVSGGMAFRVYVVLLPFAFVVVTLLGLFGKAIDPSDPVSLAKELGMTGLIATSIDASTNSSLTQQIVTLLVALYALVWSSWNLVRALRAVHGLAWEIGQLPRLTHTWRWILYLVSGLFGLFLVGVATSRLADLIGPAAELVVRLASVFGVVAAWVGISLVLPRAPGTSWRALLPGALVVGVGAWVLQLLTVYFFSHYIANKTNTYGAIGASIAILLWAYLLGRMIVTAAFLNAARWRQQHPSDENP
jgi:membrane protein